MTVMARVVVLCYLVNVYCTYCVCTRKKYLIVNSRYNHAHHMTWVNLCGVGAGWRFSRLRQIGK